MSQKIQFPTPSDVLNALKKLSDNSGEVDRLEVVWEGCLRQIIADFLPSTTASDDDEMLLNVTGRAATYVQALAGYTAPQLKSAMIGVLSKHRGRSWPAIIEILDELPPIGTRPSRGTGTGQSSTPVGSSSYQPADARQRRLLAAAGEGFRSMISSDEEPWLREVAYWRHTRAVSDRERIQTLQRFMRGDLKHERGKPWPLGRALLPAHPDELPENFFAATYDEAAE